MTAIEVVGLVMLVFTGVLISVAGLVELKQRFNDE